MLDMQNPEDRQIRRIIIAASTVVALGFLSAALTIAIMISVNFNFLEWME